ncbi:hypothetical protein J1784_19270 [Rahnella sp. FRB 231]|uniref:Uncharacterized protein n=1 Tax=Rahnella ecdela TaxID=2816250 RepID=A0ABS6LJM5_9GAMM|nr:hypothetical protein [Rahnella ecdela]
MGNAHLLEIVIASDIDYENLIAEIYCNDQYVALLQQEDGKEELKEVLGNGLKTINLDWFQHALSGAKERLLNE